MRISLVARAGLELVTFRSQSRRFPSTPHMSTKHFDSVSILIQSEHVDMTLCGVAGKRLLTNALNVTGLRPPLATRHIHCDVNQ